MKIFLSDGGFDDDPIDPNDVQTGEKSKDKLPMDAARICQKAIAHRGFSMLQVYD